METNHKKGHNRKPFHLKKHKKADDSRNFDPRSTNTEGNGEKLVLFQLGSIASYGVSDVHQNTDPEINTSRSASIGLSSSSPNSSKNIHEVDAKERKSSLSLDSSQHNKELLSQSLKLCELQGSQRSQVSGVTHASVEPPLLSPSVQLMDREGSEKHQRKSLPTLEKNMSTVSNDSLFSLSIGHNAVIARDELFSYRDFKSGEILKSGELLSFGPSVHVPVDSFDQEKSFDMEDEVSEETEVGTYRIDSEDKSSNSNVSWRNIGDCNNSDESTSSTQSFSYPIKKKKKKKTKLKKKNTQHQQQQNQKKRCSWLGCKNTGTCFSCCKRFKCCSCCSWCGWLFCCHWSCCSSKEVVVDDEMTRASEEQKLQNTESKTYLKSLCCFPCCSSLT